MGSYKGKGPGDVLLPRMTSSELLALYQTRERESEASSPPARYMRKTALQAPSLEELPHVAERRWRWSTSDAAWECCTEARSRVGGSTVE